MISKLQLLTNYAVTCHTRCRISNYYLMEWDAARIRHFTWARLIDEDDRCRHFTEVPQEDFPTAKPIPE